MSERTVTTPSRRLGRTIALRAGLLVLAVALAVSGTVFLTHDKPAATNRALVDPSSTSEVIGQVSSALNSVFSYDYRKPQLERAAAKRWLTGNAPGQFNTLFDQLKTIAPGQKLTFVAKVSTAGVTYLNGNKAKLLVFLDQESTRASDGQSSISAAQVQIGAVEHGNVWRVDNIVPL